ncbi:MAG: carbohydrate ABC transporter permease [Lentisphaerae bacterium]|nr:carbohydrate ABC transporter permease [Lentisphaerota bacterium]MCP4103338.1 carbohydrate ABC transporter permease [Lentisphaerota bacterium]
MSSIYSWRQSSAWRGFTAVLKFFFVTLLAAAMFLPFVWMVCTAFKSSTEVEGAHFWPQLTKPENFKVVLRIIKDPFSGNYLDLHILRWVFNSIFFASWTVTLQVFTSSLAAYAFSRIEWMWRDKIFLLYLSTMMIPGLVLTIPQFQIMVNLNLVDTYTGIIIPGAFSAFGTFMLRQFMLGIPMSYNEAAAIDGANHFQVYLDVILPLCKPGMITLAIFTFLGSYRSLLWPLIMIKSANIRTVPIGLLTFQGQYGNQIELLMATTVICIIPLIILFCFLQKRLVSGINLSGGVKE